MLNKSALMRSSFFGDHMLMPPGKFFSMFHFLEYPFSRGSTHIVSPDPYEAPDFDAGFMNDERDMAPMVWGYIKSRETARRMDAYAGEVTDKHPWVIARLNPFRLMLLLISDPTSRFFAYDSPARSEDLNLQDTKTYGGPNHLSAGIQHGSWSIHTKPGKPPKDSFVTSSQTANIREDLEYSKEDIAAVEEWVKRHVETTWHSKPPVSNIPYPLIKS